MNKENKWIVLMLLVTFVLSIVFNGISTIVVEKLNNYIAVLILLLVVFIGILFDIIGMAVAVCDEAPFNAKASKKIKGAKETLRLLKEKDKATNICNDLLGDICGIISGSISVLIAINVSVILDVDPIIPTLIIGGIVASITVGGKAMGKRIGIKNSEKIMEAVGKVIYIFRPVKDKNK